MPLRAQPIFDAYDAIEKKQPRVILLDPADGLDRFMLRSWLRKRNSSPSAVITKVMVKGSRPW